MHISRKLALALIAALLLCGACGTGNRLDMSGDGPGGGQYLPPILQVDSGVVDATPIIPNDVSAEYAGITYIDGVLTVPPDAGVAMDFPVGDPNSLPNFALADGTGIASADPTFDTTGDGAADFLIMGIQAMAAQAAANVTVIGPSLATMSSTTPARTSCGVALRMRSILSPASTAVPRTTGLSPRILSIRWAALLSCL